MDRAELIGLDRELAERFYLSGVRSTIEDISAQCTFFLGIGRTSTFHELTVARQETIGSPAGEPLATLAPRAPFIDGTRPDLNDVSVLALRSSRLGRDESGSEERAEV